MIFSRRLPILLMLCAALFLMGQGCRGNSAAEQAASERVTLKIWRVFDDEDTLTDIMRAYRAIHPNVSFEYRELRIDEYKDELLRAFAEGTGPDIFSVHNTWVGEWENLITPLPDSVSIPFTEVKGTIKKETITTLREIPSITQRELKSEFVDVVSQDVIRSYQATPDSAPEDRIFGLPLAVDTMALFYNRDLLNAAGIAEPPKTWSEFQDAVIALTRIGEEDTILQSGAAIGTSRNVERAFDILSLLMMQNGTPMVDDRGRAAFANETDRDFIPGLNATRFYTDFANPLKEVYTWNEEMPNSFEAFINGNTAFFFGYSYHVPIIKAQAPKLNFGISNMPQIQVGDGTPLNRVVNYANYWVETVSRGTKHRDWAWDFIQFATGEDRVTSYLEAAGKPTARRALIKDQLENEDLFVFASQLLTSSSWYRGNDAEVAEEAFLNLIDAVLAGEDAERAIKDAQNQVNQTL